MTTTTTAAAAATTTATTATTTKSGCCHGSLKGFGAYRLDCLRLADAAGGEEEGSQPIVTRNKRARKRMKGRKAARVSLGPLQKRKQALGVQTRGQGQEEDEEEVVKREDAMRC